ncbi:MAG: hypothetical protein HYR94_11215 [Chloroflexi bacterium]|nr:hypothetical protein [Chloroflexota bacterium]
MQFLGGVRLTSDSVIYSATELAQGQWIVLANSLAVLPQLWAEWPWFSVPALLFPLFGLILLGVSRIAYGWTLNAPGATHFQPFGSAQAGGALPLKTEITFTTIGLALILFISWAGLRGEQTKATLASRGFYDESHEVVYHQIKELAGRSGLVTRAMYHEYMGRPDQALADLQRASALWKSESAAAATRLYLGPESNKPLDVPLNLHLDYPGSVRLVGYQILEATFNVIIGQLFWEKLAGEESNDVVTPIIRAFDQTGNNLGNIELESPFPAEYIPIGGLFQDSFTLRLDTPADSWVWLAVGLAENPNAPPVNALGQAESGLIGSVNVGVVAPSPVISTENAQDFIGKPELLLGHTYQPGQTIPVQFLWQTSDRVASATQLELTLLDSANKVVTQQSFTIQSQRPPVGNSTYCFTLPATPPIGDYRFTLALQLDNGNWLDVPDSLPIRLTTTENASATTICDLLKADFARRYEAPAPQHPLEASFTAQIKLLGYDLAVIPQAGSATARILLHWRAQNHVSRDYLVSLQLLDAANQPVVAHTGVPANGARPTSTWLQQELILDEHLLAVPVLAPGVYRLSLALMDEQTGQPVEIAGQAHLVLQDVLVP